nr:hypothetical protein [Tanacetum cinerariifolium]
MEHSNPTLAKIPILDIGKFEQWKFWIQQYLQNEHYALWKVIEFGDSYEAPQEVADTGSASEGSAKKKGRTIAVTTKDMQKRRNDVKARTTLLLALLDEHQLRFSNSMRISRQKEKRHWSRPSTNCKPLNDLDTMSLDDIYNHLKLYEPEVQKKSESNSQNMAFISSAKNSSGNGEVNTASIPTSALKECRAPWSQDRGRRENYRQGSNEEEQAPKALMAIDRVGWDWSYMANEE